MEKIVLDSEIRNAETKSGIKKMRASGRIPAVVYGSKENVSIIVDGKKFKSLYQKVGYTGIIDITTPDKKSRHVLIKDIQRDPVSRDIIHVDFHQIDMTKKIEVSVPIALKGESPGVKAGGVLDHIIRELRVKCLPTNIPERIIVDISGLETGHSVAVKDLKVPKDVEVLLQPDQLVVNIVAPTILEEVVPGAPAEAAAEPEVIGKGKKEEEEEGAEGAKKPEGKEATKKEAAPAAATPAKGATPAPKKEEKPK